MHRLADLVARHAHPGRVDWIGLRGAKRGPMTVVPSVELTNDGLSGDRARPGKRAVTLIQAEHLPVIAALLRRGAVTPEDMRRNLVVSGINLAALKGRRLRIGTAVLELTKICAPCSRMEDTFGPGGYSAIRGHGGWCAQILSPGAVILGDSVIPAERAPSEDARKGGGAARPTRAKD